MKSGHLSAFILPLLLWVGGSKIHISGSIYAYDPVMHLARHSHAENMDIVILKIPRGDRDKYVKVIIQSFGQTLPESLFRDGRTVRLSLFERQNAMKLLLIL